VTFTLLFDGVPFIYQGQEQHLQGLYTNLQNRAAVWTTGYDNSSTLVPVITTLNKIRKHAYRMDSSYVDTASYNIYQGSSEMAFTKGVEGRQVIMLLSTQGTNSSPYTLTLPATYNAGTNVTEVLSCKTYMVNEYDASLIVDMESGLPRVFFPTALLLGSGICGYYGVL
jgi:alpha-amylase